MKLLLLILSALALYAQSVDLYPRRAATFTTLPATCTVGETAFKSDATAGQNLYGCTASNTWTQQAGSAGITWTPTRTSGTVLTLPAVAANTLAVGSYTCPTAISAGATFTVSSGTGTVWFSLGSDCTIKARHNIVASCSAGCTAVSGSSGFDPTDLQLYEWTITSAVLAASGTTVLPAARSAANIAGANMSLSTVNGVTTFSASTGLSPESESYDYEDFVSGTCQVNVTYNGKLGWQINSNSGGDSVSCTADVAANHPGVVTITAASGSGNDASIKWPNTSITPADTFTYRSLVKASSAANVKLTVALTDDNFNNVSTDGCYFEKLEADTNWFVACMSGGVASTRQDTGVAAGTGWIAFQIQRTSASNIAFKTASTLGGLSSATALNVTTQIPTVNIRPAIFVESRTAATKAIAVDFADLRLTGLTR